MIPENSTERKYWYRRYEGYEVRIQRRLKKGLGVDESVADTILRLCNQVIELQSHLHQLESELTTLHENQNMRLARYRQDYYEAACVELDIEE
jgi:hypothetical protein